MVRKLGIVAATVAISTLGVAVGAAPASAHSVAPCDHSGDPGQLRLRGAPHRGARAGAGAGRRWPQAGQPRRVSLCLGVH